MEWDKNSYLITIHADKDFNKKEQKAILEAAQEWDYFTRNKFQFIIIFDLDKFNLDYHLTKNTILKVSSNFYYIKGYDFESKTKIVGFHRYLNEYQRLIYLVMNRINTMKILKNIVMHELGHFMNCQHIEEQGVMHAFSMTSQDFTINDANELCRIYNCQLSDLNFKE